MTRARTPRPPKGAATAACGDHPGRVHWRTQDDDPCPHYQSVVDRAHQLGGTIHENEVNGFAGWWIELADGSPMTSWTSADGRDGKPTTCNLCRGSKHPDMKCAGAISAGRCPLFGTEADRRWAGLTPAEREAERLSLAADLHVFTYGTSGDAGAAGRGDPHPSVRGGAHPAHAAPPRRRGKCRHCGEKSFLNAERLCLDCEPTDDEAFAAAPATLHTRTPTTMPSTEVTPADDEVPIEGQMAEISATAVQKRSGRAASRGEIAETSAITPPSEALDLTIRTLGAPLGLQLGEITLRVQKLLALRQIRADRSYRQAGHTWDSYCRDIFGRSSDTVEAELASLDSLGEDLYRAALLAGLKGADFKALRSVPSDDLPKLLPSGAIEVNGEVIPVDAEHRDQVVQIFADLIERERSDRQRAEGARDEAVQAKADMEAKLAKLQEVVTAGESDNERLREIVNTLSLLRGDLLAPGAKVEEPGRRLVDITFHLGQVAEMVAETKPEPEVIRRFLAPLQYVFSRLARYAGGMEVDDEPVEKGADVLDFAAADAIDDAAEEEGLA